MFVLGGFGELGASSQAGSSGTIVPFDPSQVAIAWWSIADSGNPVTNPSGGGMTIGTGNTVTAWKDRMASHFTLTVSGTGATAPTLGNPTGMYGNQAVIFDGQHNVLSMTTFGIAPAPVIPTGGNPSEIWVLASPIPSPGSGNGVFVRYGATATGSYRNTFQGNFNQIAANDGLVNASSDNTYLGPLVIGAEFYPGSGLALIGTFVNGAFTRAAGISTSSAPLNTTPTRLSVGSNNSTVPSNFLKFTVREIIITGQLNTGDPTVPSNLQKQLAGWLLNSIGLGSMLPMGFPYSKTTSFGASVTTVTGCPGMIQSNDPGSADRQVLNYISPNPQQAATWNSGPRCGILGAATQSNVPIPPANITHLVPSFEVLLSDTGETMSTMQTHTLCNLLGGSGTIGHVSWTNAIGGQSITQFSEDNPPGSGVDSQMWANMKNCLRSFYNLITDPTAPRTPVFPWVRMNGGPADHTMSNAQYITELKNFSDRYWAFIKTLLPTAPRPIVFLDQMSHYNAAPGNSDGGPVKQAQLDIMINPPTGYAGAYVQIGPYYHLTPNWIPAGPGNLTTGPAGTLSSAVVTSATSSDGTTNRNYPGFSYSGGVMTLNTSNPNNFAIGDTFTLAFAGQGGTPGFTTFSPPFITPGIFTVTSTSNTIGLSTSDPGVMEVTWPLAVNPNLASLGVYNAMDPSHYNAIGEAIHGCQYARAMAKTFANGPTAAPVLPPDPNAWYPLYCTTAVATGASQITLTYNLSPTSSYVSGQVPVPPLVFETAITQQLPPFNDGAGNVEPSGMYGFAYFENGVRKCLGGVALGAAGNTVILTTLNPIGGTTQTVSIGQFGNPFSDANGASGPLYGARVCMMDSDTYNDSVADGTGSGSTIPLTFNNRPLVQIGIPVTGTGGAATSIALSTTSVTFPTAADAGSFVANIIVTVAIGTYAGTISFTGTGNDNAKFRLSPSTGVYPCSLIVGPTSIPAGTYNISLISNP